MLRNKICIGMLGAGRATELHVSALRQVSGIEIYLKTICIRRKEQLNYVKKKYGFENSTCDIDDLLCDEEIDVIDICTPPYAHKEAIIKAMRAGKHVICEKPITGYFGKGNSNELIGKNIEKSYMYRKVCNDIDEIRETIKLTNKKFMYAENFVYAPAILKAAEIIKSKKSRILYIKGEESLKGSSSSVAGEWCKTGGGTFIRTGTHPLSAVLWLKKVESEANNKKIYVKSVIADMSTVTNNLTEYEHRHIMARPSDVEDTGTAIITFSDDTKAVIMATDTCIGGSKNYVELYCNDANIKCNLTMNNSMETYFLDEDGLDDVYISEMLPSKIGWNNPFIADEFIRGYVNEMQDFMESIKLDIEPKSNFDLACETIKIVYAAYMSSELGKKIVF